MVGAHKLMATARVQTQEFSADIEGTPHIGYNGYSGPRTQCREGGNPS